MEDKVWVIEEPSDEGKRRPGPPGEGSRDEVGAEPRPPREKSPAAAFSFSVFLWGGGQFYNRQGTLGVLLLLLMVNFWAYIAVFFLYPNVVQEFAQRAYLGRSELFFIVWLWYVFGIAVWLAGAWQAYREAARRRKTRFPGVASGLLPALCSAVYPGWGQFLNGQPKKGGFFLLAGFMVFVAPVSAALIYRFSPAFDPSPTRHILDWIFALSCLSIPVLIALWPICIFDALKAGLDEVKRESWRARMGYFRNRLRVQGWKRSVVSPVVRILLVLLVLTIAVALGYVYVPKEFYLSRLEEAEKTLHKRNMAVLPKLIDEGLGLLNPNRAVTAPSPDRPPENGPGPSG